MTDFGESELTESAGLQCTMARLLHNHNRLCYENLCGNICDRVMWQAKTYQAQSELKLLACSQIIIQTLEAPEANDTG